MQWWNIMSHPSNSSALVCMWCINMQVMLEVQKRKDYSDKVCCSKRSEQLIPEHHSHCQTAQYFKNSKNSKYKKVFVLRQSINCHCNALLLIQVVILANDSTLTMSSFLSSFTEDTCCIIWMWLSTIWDTNCIELRHKDKTHNLWNLTWNELLSCFGVWMMHQKCRMTNSH